MTSKTLLVTPLVAALSVGTAYAANVEVYAIDKLDNIQDGYCIDISGGQGPQANPDNGLQGHTCYSPSGEVFVDQAFDPEQFAKGVFYMPEFEVCLQSAGPEAGASLELATCDGSEAQSFDFSGEGTITPTSTPNLCVTLGDDTRFGRSEQNQIKELKLAECSADAAASQHWGYRSAE
ncbi:ricin-type beta-trefoil lectin domain protein [Falsihalocynthiibacter sp. SS001]|uniref:ricin-type beta-trefoil lectin domain protein n=1 Tax=Falsihalocynthiibacter sp. SS001 TaxID=3349698 RepID=UPI0036D2638C